MPDQPKPRFEPPPWEQAAFERFRKTQDEARAQEELEAALREVRSPESGGAGSLDVEEAAGVGRPAEVPGKTPQEAGQEVVLPEVRIDAMLIELRGEEQPAPAASRGLIYGTIAFMIVTGTYIIVQSALLFGGVKASPGVGTLLAGVLSFVLLLIGFGFLGGAFMLFRKYRQYL